MECIKDECKRKSFAKKMCSMHYLREKRKKTKKLNFTYIENPFLMSKQIKVFGLENGIKDLTEMVKKAEMNYSKISQQLQGYKRLRLENMQELVTKINPDYKVVIENNKPKIVINEI